MNKKLKKIINLTPHDINLVDDNGGILQVFKSEGLARVEEAKNYDCEINGIDIYTVEYTKTTGLPPWEAGDNWIRDSLIHGGSFCEDDNTFYIVSNLVAQSCLDGFQNRSDLLVVGETIRNDKGQIIGCKNFYRLKNKKL